VELVYSQYKTNDHSSAIKNFNKAMELNPANENSRYYATLLYIQQRNKTMAQKMVDELKNLNSKYVTELQNKVNAL
jgi:outer membrane protein assembly factor BamD (BamD/ComL family)